MDPKMEYAVLRFISKVMGTDVESMTSLRDGLFFTQVLTLLDEMFEVKQKSGCEHKEILDQTRMFLEDYYNNTNEVLNFDIITLGEEKNEEMVKLELAKIAIALLCVGILDKKGQVFIDAALELPVDHQENVLLIFKSVLAPDTGEMSLTGDLEHVLRGIKGGRSETPVSNFLQESGEGELSSCESLISTSTSCTPQSHPPGQRQANGSLLNASFGDIASPFKHLDITASPSASFVEFIQSPQFVQKAVLKQKDVELRRLRQQLNTEIILREEQKLNADELQALNKQKDAEIQKLHQRIVDLLAEQESAPSVAEMAARLQKAEEETKTLREKSTLLVQCKEQCDAVDAENKTLLEDLKKMQEEMSTLRMKHQVQCERLSAMDGLERQVETQASQVQDLTFIRDRLEHQKAMLQIDLEVARDQVLALRQTVAELKAKQEEKAAAEGESMSVVLDIQMRELKKQMEELHQERDTLLQELKKAKADAAAKEEQVAHKESLWGKAREANQALSQTLALERDTVVKMKARMETYAARCQDLNIRLQETLVKSQSNELELERLQSELEQTRELLQACKEDLTQARLQSQTGQTQSSENSTLDRILSTSDLVQNSVLSDRHENETGKPYLRMHSAPVLPQRHGSTVSLQSVRSMAEYQFSALLPNGMSCAAEPDSPECRWDTISRLRGVEKSNAEEESKRSKRKGLSIRPENDARLDSQGSRLKQRKKSGGTTLYFPLDPNGPVYPPPHASDRFRLTSRRMISPPHIVDSQTETTSSSSSFQSLTASGAASTSATSSNPRPLVTSLGRAQSVNASKYTPAKRAGRRYHCRQSTRPSVLNL